MPLRVPQEPIITEQKNGGVTTPAPLTVPYQYAARRRRLQRALAATLSDVIAPQHKEFPSMAIDGRLVPALAGE